MKRMVIILFVLLLVPTLGINTINDIEEKEKEEYIEFSFPPPNIQERKGSVFIEFNGSYILNESYPMLPYKTKVFRFPFGTKILGINVEVEEETIHLDKKILPSPPTFRDGGSPIHKIHRIYDFNRTYPKNWISYHIGAGFDGEHVIFLSIRIYPYTYIPSENLLKYATQIKIKIDYTPPDKPLFTNDEYDLLIICPSQWKEELEKLREHKEQHGIRTIIVTLDEIDIQGRDDAEKIKYYIKKAIEEYGIKYVMLVGGRQGGVRNERWLMPVRYAHLDDGGEKRFLSDLYFADIYKYEDGEIKFEDWDSNGNGIYGEWRWGGKDILDLYPDVYVGRLACRNKMELRIMIEKIITYENTAYGKEWFKRFVGIAGDTYPNENENYYEGELATAEAFKYLEGFEANFIWTSNGNLKSHWDIINAINQGCGFLHFSGHGNPMSWATHPPHDEETWIGIDVTKFPLFSNKDMYPICIVGGCHNNQFNVTLLNLLKIKHLKEIYYKSEWSPECWGWWLARNINGGSIATIANTGYGYGIPGENCLKGRGRYMEICFFKSYAEGREYLGEVHAQDLIYYLNEFPPMSNLIDTKIVEQWALLGDPSLKIGGYEVT